jgi:hypothetical protein
VKGQNREGRDNRKRVKEGDGMRGASKGEGKEQGDRRSAAVSLAKPCRRL